MKNKFNFKVVLLTMLSIFTLMAQPVNAESEQSVQSIIEQVQEHNLREEDVQEELEQLSMSELKDVQEYLSNKHDVTMIEKQVLNLTQDLLAGGNSVGYVAQESLQTSNERDELRLEAEEFVDGLSEEEINTVQRELKNKDERNIEEEAMYDVIKDLKFQEELHTLTQAGKTLTIIGLAGIVIIGITQSLISTKYLPRYEFLFLCCLAAQLVGLLSLAIAGTLSIV